MVTATACSGKSSRDPEHEHEPASEPEPEASPTAAFAAWDTARKAAICKREVRCGRYATVGGCVEMLLDGIWSGYAPWYTRFFGGVDLYADIAAEYSLGEQATRDACLAEIETGDCNQWTFHATSCDGTLVPKNPLAEGEECTPPSPYLPTRPCREGLVCSAWFTCGVCVPAAPASRPLAEGETCEASEDCEVGLFCAAARDPRTCTRFPTIGEACVEFLCAEGSCQNDVCVPLVGGGEPCGDVAGCKYDLQCDGTECVPRKLTGETCPRFQASVADSCAGFCVFDEPDAPEGTCGLPSNEAPTACPEFAVGSWYCPFGSYLDTRGESSGGGATPGYCMCLPALPLGAACGPITESSLVAGPCKDGWCSDGVCVEQGAEGTACATSEECASSNCDVTTGTCAAKCAP